MLAVELALGGPLQESRTAKGHRSDIVSFEIAGTPECSGAIMDSWRERGVVAFAKWGTWLDYLFLLCYPNLTALGITGLLSLPMSNAWRSVGRGLAWSQWLVLVSDATENAALLRILYGTATAPWPQMALVCATIKFGFLAAGLAYLLLTFIRTRPLLLGRRRTAHGAGQIDGVDEK
jgi:hypothetical protein